MSDLAVGQVIRLADGRNAVIRFVGGTTFAPGVWVGCELDDGTGKNDGSVQGERYFECDMGHGMFLRPAAVTVIAQPPPPKQRPAAAPAGRKRPSSFASGSRSASSTLDPGAGRRKSMNAPSPSPVPKTSRPSSMVRVSSLRGQYIRILLTRRPSTTVPYQISDKTTRHRRFECLHVPNRNPGECAGRSGHESSSAVHEQPKSIHGPSREAGSSSIRVFHDRRKGRGRQACERPSLVGDRQSSSGDIKTQSTGVTVRRGKEGGRYVPAEGQQ